MKLFSANFSYITYVSRSSLELDMLLAYHSRHLLDLVFVLLEFLQVWQELLFDMTRNREENLLLNCMLVRNDHFVLSDDLRYDFVVVEGTSDVVRGILREVVVYDQTCCQR